ncbi:MAG: hypothetical protein ACFFA5_03725 [Promethearchaeota archaeon]
MTIYMEERLEHILCKFCNKPTAMYVCLECNSLFCETCAHMEVSNYYFCSVCFSSDIRKLRRINKDITKLFCGNCGSSKIKEGKQKLELCPACESKKYEHIYTHQRNLFMKYREFCEKLNLALEESQRFVKSLGEYRDLVLKLRSQGYFTFPLLEKTLLEAYSSFDNIEKQLIERESLYLSALRRYMMDFLNKKQIQPYLFKNYKEKLERIDEAYTVYKTGVDRLFDGFENSFEEIESTLKCIEENKEQFEERKEVLRLGLKEKPLCNLPDITCKLNRSSFPIKTGRGQLFFTNYRLIFTANKGLVSKNPVKLFELPLSKIIGCSIHERKFSKKLLLKTTKGLISFSGDMNSLKEFVQHIKCMKEWAQNCAKEDIIEDLKRCTITLSEIKRKTDRDIQELLENKHTKMFDVGLRPRLRFRDRIHGVISPIGPIGPIGPSLHPRVGPVPPHVAKEIERLEREIHSIEKTIELLDTKFKSGGIPKEYYLQKYRTLTAELYQLKTQLDELNGEKR